MGLACHDWDYCACRSVLGPTTVSQACGVGACIDHGTQAQGIRCRSHPTASPAMHAVHPSTII